VATKIREEPVTPDYVLKWVGLQVEMGAGGGLGTVLEATRRNIDGHQTILLRVLGANGFIYPGVDAETVSVDELLQ
jgi:hypothetical protein